MGLPDQPSWLVNLTTNEDCQVVKALGLEENVDALLTDEAKARGILNKVNDAANRLRNVSGFYDRATVRKCA